MPPPNRPPARLVLTHAVLCRRPTARPLRPCTDRRCAAFDDYMEMVVESGYLTLFAAAFPLAPAISLVYHLVEVCVLGRVCGGGGGGGEGSRGKGKRRWPYGAMALCTTCLNGSRCLPQPSQVRIHTSI